MPIKIIKTNFNAGELSPNLDGRTDVSKYYSGCSELVNCVALPYGGITKRTGSIFVAKSKMFSQWVTGVPYPAGCVAVNTVSTVFSYYYCNTAHTAGTFATDLAAAKWTLIEGAVANATDSKIKLFSFEFSVEDTHILEFGIRYMRVYKNGARVYETAQSLTSISLTHATPVVITKTSHGWTTGNTVYMTVSGKASELNAKEFVITKITDNTFSLDGTDGVNYTDAGTFTATGKRVYEIATPFNSTEIFEVHKAQSADVMYISHEDHTPQILSRLSDASWTLADITFDAPPFLTENTTAASLMGFARTGGTARSGYYFPAGATGTLTASGTGNAPFLTATSHIGSYWLIKHTRTDNSTTTVDNATNVAPDDLANAVKIKGAFTFDIKNFAATDVVYLWRKEGNGDWQKYQPFTSATAYSSTEKEDDTYYAFTTSAAATTTGILEAKSQINYGIVKVTAWTSTTVVTVEVIDPVLSNNTNDNAVTTAMWAEGAWSPYRGYPRTVSFYEDRLYWASSTNDPQTLWGSCVGEYLNHTAGDTDSDAVILPLNANDISQIQWIAARKTMIVGTASAEFALSATNPDDPLTAIDKKSEPVSNFGSSDIQPAILNNSLFYFQRQGRKLRVMTFAYEIDSYKSEDSTMLANHILESSPVCVAVQLIPESVLWIVREDGVLCAFTYEPGENVFAAWSRCVTGSPLLTPVGYYESCAVVHGTTEDELYVSVKRIIDGNTVRYIEYFAPRFFDALDESMNLDCAKVQSSDYSPKNVIYASDTTRWDEGNFNSGFWY
jgi:hypothetical protein